jgi:hypothetical protein
MTRNISPTLALWAILLTLVLAVAACSGQAATTPTPDQVAIATTTPVPDPTATAIPAPSPTTAATVTTTPSPSATTTITATPGQTDTATPVPEQTATLMPPTSSPPPTNTSPEVGAEAEIGRTAILQLRGSVSDDITPVEQLEVRWTQVSGPGPVEFDDPSTVNTTAAFTVPGTYVLRLTASDGQFTISDDVTIVVQP